MTVRHELSNLMDLISQALVPPFIAEHIFANKDKIANAMSKNEVYRFASPTGEAIEIRMDENV